MKIDFPVLVPTKSNADFPATVPVSLPKLQPASLPETDTEGLKLALQSPNLGLSGYSLEIEEPIDSALADLVPPIPGVVIIPGNVAFLNQYFSVLLMTSNVAPGYSDLVVKDLHAEILLPTGNDTVADTGDDPLRMARLGDPPQPQSAVQPIAQPGPDGLLGTPDDILSLAPQQNGNAEFLVEGRSEGVHTVEMKITGMLHGLPIGPVKVSGRAMGVVEVRNPQFALTFNHPATVSAGEEYDFLVTVTNIGRTPANFVSLNLLARSLSGADLLSDPVASIPSIPAGDAATVSFRLRSQQTGSVVATSLAADDIAGKFNLRMAVGALGIPMSPNTLVLPSTTNSLPARSAQRRHRPAGSGLCTGHIALHA